MSNRTITAVLRISAKLGSLAAFVNLSNKLNAVEKQAKRFNRSQTMIAAGAKNMHAAMLRYAAPALSVAGGAAAVKSFAAIERRMTRIGITADATAQQTVSGLGRVRQIAEDLQAPMDNVIDGFETLVASGRTWKEAMDLLPAVTASAHAADAAASDIATTVDSIGSAFDITAHKMQHALDILVHGGKLGKFELKDMAAELPSLAPAFAALGYEGEEGLKRLTAALQTVRLETGTSGEAATAFMDVLTKMNSTTIANNFKKNFGVDVRKEMEKTKKTGEDTLEAFIRLSREAIKGDMSKLPLLFTDKQMLIGMRALMNNTDEFRGFIEGLGTAAGATRKDLERLFDTQGKLDKLGNTWRKLKEEFGSSVVDSGAVDAVNSVVDNVSYANAVNRGLNSQGIDTFWERTKWGVRHGRAAKDSMAWRGGYRTDEQRRVIAAYSDYARSRAEAPLGTTGPVSTPTPRPVIAATPLPVMPLPAVEAIRVPPPRPFAAGASPRDAERTSMAALRSDPNGIADAIDQALASGGGKAAAKIADGGQVAGDRLGDAANAKIISGATDVGNAIGAAAAAKIRGALNMNAIRAVTGREGSRETDL